MTGQELRALRGRHRLTQAALARILGVTVTTVSRWECGRWKIDDLRADGIIHRLAACRGQTQHGRADTATPRTESEPPQSQ